MFEEKKHLNILTYYTYKTYCTSGLYGKHYIISPGRHKERNGRIPRNKLERGSQGSYKEKAGNDETIQKIHTTKHPDRRRGLKTWKRSNKESLAKTQEKKLKLVVDANILFSALIKNSFTANLLFEETLELYAPEYILEEFSKHKKLILRKTSRTEEEYKQAMHSLKEIMRIEQDYDEIIDEAEKISPDEKDALYFALALKLGCAIWSNDKKLKDQNKIKIINTKELSEIITKDIY
jgi:predicted nucleic acid-binding protein